MNNLIRAAAAGVLLSLGTAAAAGAQGGSPAPAAPHRESVVTNHASGTFEVKLNPQAPEENVGDPTIGRMSLDKQFHGDIEGTSKGQMLTAGATVKDSGAYVAVERITGTLHGKRGSFVVHHTGVMTRGAPHLTITVVPDSGTGELAGLSGTMTITIAEGRHFYEFDYTMPK